MSLSGEFNGRYSKGPLYSARELREVEAALARDGYMHVEDNKLLGLRIYNRTLGEKTGEVCIYLDAAGCHPNNSGIMMIVENGNPLQTSTVWDYAKQRRGEVTTNPVMKLLRRMF